MLLQYLWLLMCLNSVFGCHIGRGEPHFTVNDEQYLSIAMNVNSTVNPCDDFYAYACGSYAENHPDIHYQEITSFMDYQFNNQILNLMDTLYQHDYQVPDRCQTFVEKTRIYFKSCRSTSKRQIEKYLQEVKPAKRLNWPIWQPQQWSKNGEARQLFNVWSLVGLIQSYGLNNVLINQQIIVEANGNTIILLEPPNIEDEGTILPDEMIMKALLRFLGVNRTETILENLFQLNKVLLGIIKTLEDSEESLVRNYGQLNTTFPKLYLRSFLRELFQKELPSTTMILIRKPEYFQTLNDKMWQLFRRGAMCNYLMLKFLEYLAKDSVNEFTSLACIKDLRNKMDVSVNYLYQRHILGKDTPEIVKDISKLQQLILLEYDKVFNENHLELDASKLMLLKDKLQAVTLNLGNLPFNSTDMVIENYYDNLPPLDRNNYFKNHLHLLRHRFEKSLLYTPNQTHYIVSDNSMGSDSGAFYVAKQNMILLPFGSLQKPFYHLNYQPLYKISVPAFILSHEYTHAFDTQGLQYNSNGEDSEDIASILEEPNFKNSIECLQSQLFTDSIDERLADIVASRVVYNLFKSHPETKKFFCHPEETPCGPEKLASDSFYQKHFYLNMAQFFCGKSQIQFVDHDSDSARINQIAINSKGFAEAFNCPVGSKMNPAMKCRVY